MVVRKSWGEVKKSACVSSERLGNNSAINGFNKVALSNVFSDQTSADQYFSSPTSHLLEEDGQSIVSYLLILGRLDENAPKRFGRMEKCPRSINHRILLAGNAGAGQASNNIREAI